MTHRSGVAQFLIKEILELEFIGHSLYFLPILCNLMIMIRYLITAGASVIDNAFFKQRIIIRQYISAEFR